MTNMRKTMNLLENKQIDALCKKFGITSYTVNDGLVDVGGEVALEGRNLTKIPIPFGHVAVGFNFGNNRITNLMNSPHTAEDFHCFGNLLTSLKLGPKNVSGWYTVSENKLTNLHGSPDECEEFHCTGNFITSLEGCPRTVYDRFVCDNNKLTSLDGGPISCGEFIFKNNKRMKLAVESFAHLLDMETIGSIESDYPDFDKIVNDFLEEDLDPHLYGNRLKFSLLITRYVRNNT